MLTLVAAAGRDFWAPDEPDFAEHVREMLERGSLLLPYENGKPYSEKPILFYWAVAATTPFSGGDVKPFATRLPSVLAGAALVFFAASFAGRRGGEREALVAGAATAVAPIVFWQGQFLQVDALFSCLLMLALVSLFFLEDEEGAPRAGWRGRSVSRLARAVLTKGPLAIVLAGLVVLARCADRRSWAPLLAVCNPFEASSSSFSSSSPGTTFAARAGGPAYAYDLVVNQNWNRFFQAFDHIQPWWFYFESMWSDFFPWTALALAAPFVLARAGLLRERPELRFAATAAAVTFVFLSLSQAKQGKYLLAAYPFAAVLVAALAAEAERRARAGRAGLLLAVRGWVGFAALLLFLAAVALAPATRRFAAEQADLVPFAAIPIGLGAVGTIAVLVRRRREAVPALLALAATVAAGEVAAGAVVFPAIDTLKTGRPFYERLRPRVSHGEPLAYFGETYRCYPILVLRRKTEHFESDAALAEWIERTPGSPRARRRERAAELEGRPPLPARRPRPAAGGRRRGPAPGAAMTPLRDSLVFEDAPERHPGRHEVVNATLERGGERIPVVVKKVPLDLRQRLTTHKAERSFATARALLARSLATPEPLAAEIVGDESWYVARRLEGASQIRAWFLHRDDPRRPVPSLPFSFEEVVDALGRLGRRMHDAGVFFRDFTDGNVLVTGEAGSLRLWLVDLNRARVGVAPVPALSRYRDLARPGLNRLEDINLLLSSYFLPDPPPARAVQSVRWLRRRIVLWDDFKAFARPWRR